MATTKIWAIKDSISRVVNYAENPDKTTNLNENGFKIMKEALAKYIEAIDKENAKGKKKSLSDLVAEDTEVLGDTPYMQAVYEILDKEKLLLEESRIDC